MSEKEKKPLSAEELEKASGGSALDNVPAVDEHDYDNDVRKKAGADQQPLRERKRM